MSLLASTVYVAWCGLTSFHENKLIYSFVLLVLASFCVQSFKAGKLMWQEPTETSYPAGHFLPQTTLSIATRETLFVLEAGRPPECSFLLIYEFEISQVITSFHHHI